MDIFQFSYKKLHFTGNEVDGHTIQTLGNNLDEGDCQEFHPIHQK